MRNEQTTTDRLREIAHKVYDKADPKCKRCKTKNRCEEFGCAIIRYAADRIETGEKTVNILTENLKCSADALEKARKDLSEAKQIVCRRCGRSENSSGPLCEGCRWRGGRHEAEVQTIQLR